MILGLIITEQNCVTEMVTYNQSFNQVSNKTDNEEVPVFAIFLIVIFQLTSAVIVITLDVMVINVIGWTRQLHTKYFFLVAHLLGTDIAGIIVRLLRECLIIILYQLGLNSDSTTIIVKWLVILPSIVLFLMSILLPITLATERMIVIAFPYRHRDIMTNKRVAGMLAVMWGTAAILATIMITTGFIDIYWPQARVYYHHTAFLFLMIPRAILIVTIIAANIFLQYKITISNRKAKENERLGNEEEIKKFHRLVQVVKAQAKATITLFVVGGIDIIASILLPIIFVLIHTFVEPDKIYLSQFIVLPLQTSVLLSHPLLYGFYMKKIRRRLPSWITCNCHRQWIIHRHNRVGVLQQQRQRAAVTNTTV